MSALGFDFTKLMASVDWSIQQLTTPRKKRVEAVKQYVGGHYSDAGSDRVVPTNFLELAITIYTRQLAARSPQVIITAGVSSLRPFAKSMELALNQIPGEIDLGATLRRAVIEALFSFAVVKVGISDEGKTVGDKPYGEPFVDLVSIDDYFCDMSAKTRKGIQYEGNDYWVTLEEAKAMCNDKPEEIEADPHTVQGSDGATRAEAVSVAEGADIFSDRVWLRDVWICRLNKLVTYGVKSKKLIRVVDWDGPDHGPYHMLGFSDVPGNLLPLPPVALWRDMHDLANQLMRRLGRQAEAKKTVEAFSGGNDDAAQALKNAQDGEGIVYSGSKPEQITVGGIDAATLAFYLQIKDLFSYFAGNLDTLGGLSPQSDTLGQDKLLSEAASSRVNSMGESVVDFVKGIFKSLAWYDWTDPIRVRTVRKKIKGTDIEVVGKWSAETRDGDFLDYNLDIDVYSMQDDSPSTKLQKLGVALERFVFPMLPMVQQQGGQIDFQKLIELVGKLGNIPELTELVRFVEPQQQAQAVGNPDPMRMPTNTTRTYERVNRPGATRSGKDGVLAQILMGGKPQQSEAAVLGRGVS